MEQRTYFETIFFGLQLILSEVLLPNSPFDI